MRLKRVGVHGTKAFHSAFFCMACRALGVNIINAILAPVAKPHNVIDFVIVRQFNSTLTLTVLSGKYRLSFGVCPLPAANAAHFQP